MALERIALISDVHGNLTAYRAVLADIASRILIPQQVLPIGVVTALVGAPVVILVLLRSRRAQAGTVS